MTPEKHFMVSTFYHFTRLQDPDLVKKNLETTAQSLQIQGLIIIGTEGFNATISATTENEFSSFKDFIRNYFNVPHLFFKDSISTKKPFRRFKIKIRPEIVTLGTPELIPDNKSNHHLSPAEWNEMLKSEDVLIIDTRNWYETQIGTFKGAINPGIDQFTEFPQFMKANNIPSDQKMMIFCTGGIRCEKGILELQRQGFKNVYQLNGGIINYLKNYPNDMFEGECFVFDQRVALDQNLQPTQKYDLCPHCGQPGSLTISCHRCEKEQMICDTCSHLKWKQDTCSKNCSYQYEMSSRRKGDFPP